MSHYISHNDQFEHQCNLLREFTVLRERLPKRSSQNKEEQSLANFVSRQRSAQDRGKLLDERARALNNISKGILAWKAHLSTNSQPSNEWEKAFQENSSERHGIGKITYPDGATYEGEWKEDQWNGRGFLTKADGSTYEGDFVEDKKHGRGKFKYSNGDVFEGEFKSDKRQGSGKCTYSNGDVYEGEWEGDDVHGYGTRTYESGSVYEGQWEKKKKHGKGKMTNANGDVYNGEWKKDEKHGTGTLMKANGEKYKQVFNNDQCTSEKRVATLINGPPSQRSRTDEISDIVVLNDDYKVCFLCRDEFSTDIYSTDDDVRDRLPIVSVCNHCFCLGCILKQQMAHAESNRGRVRKTVDCPKCRTKKAFCPSEPKYHNWLIDLLEARFPAVEEHTG